jgi:Tol biopolymer transport system component
MPAPVRTSIVLAALVALIAASCSGGDGGSSYTDRMIVVRNEGLAELSLASGHEKLILPKPEDSVLIEPALSPAGDRLAYVRQLTPIVIPGEPVELGMDLYLAAPDGSNPVLLLEHSQPNEAVRSPAWFPDGRRMLINVQNLSGAQITSSIESLDIETGALAMVLENALQPSLSPDGARLAFVRLDDAFNQSLWIANADGTDARQIAGPNDGLGAISSPRFSPDGRTIAFGAAPLQGGSIRARSPALVSRAFVSAASANGIPQNVWIYDIESGGLRMLAELLLDQPGVDWSGDGATIFVFAGAGLFAVDPLDGKAERLADGTFHGQLAWLAAE